MEDNELGALLRYNRQTNIEGTAIIIMVMLAMFAILAKLLDAPLIAGYLYVSALIFFVVIFGILTPRTSRTSAFIRSRQPIKTIEW
jgi:hypothetical protein